MTDQLVQILTGALTASLLELLSVRVGGAVYAPTKTDNWSRGRTLNEGLDIKRGSTYSVVLGLGGGPGSVRQTLVLAGRQVVTSEPKTSRGRRSIALDPRSVFGP